MNTDITDTKNFPTRPWVCYDAECAMCVRWARRFRALLERHGFSLVALQSPRVAAVLGVPKDELLSEMRVITRDGHVFGGADALVYLSRFICKPLFALVFVPGMRPALRALYRLVARNRSCSAGACAVQPRRGSHQMVGNAADWLPLLVLVPAAAVVGRRFSPWLYMWLIAFAMFAGCKWICFRRWLDGNTAASSGKKAGFLFGWVGMDGAAFASSKATSQAPRGAEWIRAALRILLGAVLIWSGVRLVLTLNTLLAGWVGMVGLILVLHFGLFQLAALGWRSAGVPVTPVMRAPLLSHSPGEFWGERWNTAFNQLTVEFLFRPARRAVGTRMATMLVFLVSGLVHELVISVPARGGYGLPTLYFLLQGAGILFEHTTFARRLGLGRGLRGWLFTLIIAAGPAFWLFHPVFIRNVILPFFKSIGAT